MSETGIPYCDKTWDLTIGCRKRSEGCANCWAVRVVHRLAGKGLPAYRGQVMHSGDDWIARQDINLVEVNLGKPLRWRKPRFIFINSKSDLFDERVPFGFIARVFDVMALPTHHRFMIVTKEPERMGDFIQWYQGRARPDPQWPFNNVILMVTVENGDYLHRIETLKGIPAAMRGVSFEPLIGPVGDPQKFAGVVKGLDWLVIGCEQLPGGRLGRWAASDSEAWWREATWIACVADRAGIAIWMKQGPARDGRRVTSDTNDFPIDAQTQDKPKGLML